MDPARNINRPVVDSETVFLRQIIDTDSNLVFVKDEAGSFVFVNQAMASLYGMSSVDLVRRKNAEVLPVPGDAEEYSRVDLQVLQGNCRVTLEEIHHVSEGADKWFLTSKAPIRLPDGRMGVMGVAQDISERKRIEEALRQSEAQFRDLAECTSDWLWEVNAKGQYTYCSPKVKDLLGYEPSEIVGKTPFDLMPGEEAARVRAEFERLLAGGRDLVALENTNLHKDGRRVVLETSGVPFYGADGTLAGYRGIDRDVTERKRADQALRDAEERLRLAVEIAGLGTWDLNPISGKLTWSDRCKAIFGLEPGAEIDFEQWIALVHPEDRARMRAVSERTMDPGGDGASHVEYRIVRPDGTIRWLDSNGRAFFAEVEGRRRAVRLLGTIMDVTDRQRTEEALRDSRRMLQLVLDTIPVRVLWKDRDSLYLGCNRMVMQDAGLNSPEELIGKDDFQFPWKEQATQYRADDRGVMESGQAKLNYEEPQTTADGRVLWIRTSKIPLRDPNGTIIGILGTWEDITDRKLAEGALARAKDAAEAANLAKDRFLATLSHELRTPLTPILLTAGALAGDAALPERVREEMQLIARNAELEARLIDDLLDLTRISRGKLKLALENIDAHELIRQAVEACRRSDLGEKSLQIAVELSARRHHVSADPARFQQIIWNLVRNAMKFTPAGGSICVRSQNDSGGQLSICVSDTGIGIDPERLPHIFDAFEQGEPGITRRFGGLGLGLTICKALAELHHGTIAGQSEGKGRGATFTLTLPTVAPAAAVMAAPPEPEAASRALRILVVEDHESTARILRQLLMSLGHEVKVADSVASALAAAAANKVELLISDLGLPDGSGHDLMRQLKAQYGLRGIALSGYGTEDDLRRSREAGFAEHLVKPIKLAALEAAITSAVAT